MPAVDWVPFLWPAAWRDAEKLHFIQGTPFNCAVGDGIAPALREAQKALDESASRYFTGSG